MVVLAVALLGWAVAAMAGPSDWPLTRVRAGPSTTVAVLRPAASGPTTIPVRTTLGPTSTSTSTTTAATTSTTTAATTSTASASTSTVAAPTTTVARPATTVTTTASPVVAPAAAPSTTAGTSCPNGSYVNVSGDTVCSPSAASTPPAGASAVCKDGTYSFSEHRSGTCSGHGGVAQWLKDLP